MDKKSFCITCQQAFANTVRQEASKKGLSHEAFLMNIFFFWQQNSESIAKLKQDLISGKRIIIDRDNNISE